MAKKGSMLSPNTLSIMVFTAKRFKENLFIKITFSVSSLKGFLLVFCLYIKACFYRKFDVLFKFSFSFIHTDNHNDYSKYNDGKNI